MNSSVIDINSKAFRDRLVALLHSNRKSLSPTKLAREFNLRWRGSPITPNSARKWITGESIPTLDKIDLLANMLGTSTQWLRWGEKNTNQIHSIEQNKEIYRISFEPNLEKSIIQDYRLLNRVNQRIIFNLMEIMLREQRIDES